MRAYTHVTQFNDLSTQQQLSMLCSDREDRDKMSRWARTEAADKNKLGKIGKSNPARVSREFSVW